jgi:hypothetical protein
MLAASISQRALAAISERNQEIVAERADWDQNFPKLLGLYDCLVRSAVVMKA